MAESIKPKLQLKPEIEKILKQKKKLDRIMSQQILYDDETLEQTVVHWLIKHGYNITFDKDQYLCQPHRPGALVNAIGKTTITHVDIDQLLT